MSFTTTEWKPSKKQEIFLSLPLSIKEAKYGGGAGSAKTETLLVYPLVWKWHEHPGFKQVFMRRTFPELRNEIIPRSRQLYPKFGATLNKSDMAWTFPAPDQFGGRGLSNAGAMIFLGQCEDESDVSKYDSMEINLFTPDELTSFTEYIYLYIGFTRVRTSDPKLPAIIRAGGMPGGIGHTWVAKRFPKAAPYGTIIKGKGGNKRIYIHATLADNPHIDPEYKRSLEMLPEAEKRAKLYGDWDSYAGQVFDEFRDRHYPDEPENAVHVIEPFEIPDWWPKYIVGDWGYAAMTWIGFAAISPDGRLYIYRELSWVKTKISVWAPDVKYFIEEEGPRFVKFCRSAGQDRGQDHTIQEQISSELGTAVDLVTAAPGSRVSGKQLIHEYLRWKPKPFVVRTSIEKYDDDKAQRILRMRGIEEYKSYLESFEPEEEEDNIPKLQIFNTCPILVDAIKACSYDKKKIEDIAAFAGDDPIDALRYIVDAAEQFFEESADEFNIIKKRQELLNRAHASGNWTGFYMGARKLESGDSEKMKPVRMFHHNIHRRVKHYA